MEKCSDLDLTPNQTTDATIDKLIKEVKNYGRNALLKDENKRLIKDKSNTCTCSCGYRAN